MLIIYFTSMEMELFNAFLKVLMLAFVVLMVEETINELEKTAYLGQVTTTLPYA